MSAEDRWAAGWLPMPRSHFADLVEGGSALWHKKRVFSEYEAWLYLWTKAAWGEREWMVGAQLIHLTTGETPPLSVRALMHDWGWKSVKRVHGFLSLLSDRGEIRQIKSTKNGNTYLFVNASPKRNRGNESGTQRERTGNATGTLRNEVEKERNSPPSGERRAHARRTRLVPEDWNPTPEQEAKLRSIAAQRGVDYGAEMEKFRDHEFKEPHSDWFKAACNWMRRAEPERYAGNGRHTATTGMVVTPSDEVAEAILLRMRDQ